MASWLLVVRRSKFIVSGSPGIFAHIGRGDAGQTGRPIGLGREAGGAQLAGLASGRGVAGAHLAEERGRRGEEHAPGEENVRSLPARARGLGRTARRPQISRFCTFSALSSMK